MSYGMFLVAICHLIDDTIPMPAIATTFNHNVDAAVINWLSIRYIKIRANRYHTFFKETQTVIKGLSHIMVWTIEKSNAVHCLYCLWTNEKIWRFIPHFYYRFHWHWLWGMPSLLPIFVDMWFFCFLKIVNKIKNGTSVNMTNVPPTFVAR